MKQVTLVAHYGPKLRAFEKYIGICVRHIVDSPLRRFFTPYHMNQVHATIVGMEKVLGYPEQFNANIWRETGERKEMDFDRLLDTVRRHRGFMIRFGGFGRDNRCIDSFGSPPYIRSFECQWASRKVTVMGWHHQDGDFSPYTDLWALRKDLGDSCNVMHKYKNDSDFFVAIGDLTNLETVSDEELMGLMEVGKQVEQAVRDKLATDSDFRVNLPVSPDSLYVVQYERETLAMDSTKVFSITRSNVDKDFISALYDS